MASRPLLRLRHVKNSIQDVRMLLEGKDESALAGDRVARLAVERSIEMISEASRHLPEEWKQSLGSEVPWSKIASVGNVLRHIYDRVDLAVLWSIYENDLDPLERAVDAMLAAHTPKDGA